MDLLQALRQDEAFLNLLLDADSIDDVIEYCNGKSYLITLQSLKEGFGVPLSVPSELCLEYIRGIIVEQIQKCENTDEDQELENVTGGFAVIIASVAAAVASGAFALGNSKLNDKFSRKRDEQQQAYNLELINAQADAAIRIEQAKNDLSV